MVFNFCHDNILKRPEALAWFEERGVPLEMVKKMRLGFNPGQKAKGKGKEYQNSYKFARAWGMPELPAREDGTRPDKIVLPAGLVIPCFDGDPGDSKVVRVQIRKMDQSRWVVKGSCGYSKAHLILNPGKDIVLVNENERDGMAIAQAYPNVTVIPVAMAKGKPCQRDHEELRGKKLILMALDPDKTSESSRKKWEQDYPGISCPDYALGAGVVAVDWWYEQYHQASPWVIDGYGDIGAAILAGEDIGAWVQRGIAYYLGDGKKEDCKETEEETRLHVFCRLLHQFGMHFTPAEDMHEWSCGPEPVGMDMYDVPSGKIDKMMFEDDVWPFLVLLWKVDPGRWTGKRIWEYFNESL